jgi:hypothetical protein
MSRHDEGADHRHPFESLECLPGGVRGGDVADVGGDASGSGRLPVCNFGLLHAAPLEGSSIAEREEAAKRIGGEG